MEDMIENSLVRRGLARPYHGDAAVRTHLTAADVEVAGELRETRRGDHRASRDRTVVLTAKSTSRRSIQCPWRAGRASRALCHQAGWQLLASAFHSQIQVPKMLGLRFNPVKWILLSDVGRRHV